MDTSAQAMPVESTGLSQCIYFYKCRNDVLHVFRDSGSYVCDCGARCIVHAAFMSGFYLPTVGKARSYVRVEIEIAFRSAVLRTGLLVQDRLLRAQSACW